MDQTPETSKDDAPFLSSFVTPLLKATKKGKKGEMLSFYNMAEYQAWREFILSAGDEEQKKWNVKYYKGLGTSTPGEAKEYFAAFDNHYRPFYWGSESDGELLDMVFDSKRASDRRNWILDEYDESVNLSVDPSDGNRVSYEDFVNKEMIHFSQADNIRSIPSLIDGLKPSQRKVLYACFKRNLKSEIKVAQLTGYCAEHTAYHHGETSLQSTSTFALSHSLVLIGCLLTLVLFSHWHGTGLCRFQQYQLAGTVRSIRHSSRWRTGCCISAVHLHAALADCQVSLSRN
jgi:hypothetical protein